MEYVYAALILHEAEEEINEENLTAVLEAAGVGVQDSRVKALVAALEDVDIEEALEQAAAMPTAAAGGAGAEAESGGAEEAEAAAEEAEEEEAEAEAEEEEEDVSGEGLGDLFG